VGTTSEWMRVCVVGAIYGGITILWEAIAHGKRESSGRLRYLMALAITCLLFGMMVVFEWRVLHGELGVVFTIGVLAVLVLGFAERRARRPAEVSSKTR